MACWSAPSRAELAPRQRLLRVFVLALVGSLLALTRALEQTGQDNQGVAPLSDDDGAAVANQGPPLEDDADSAPPNYAPAQRRAFSLSGWVDPLPPADEALKGARCNIDRRPSLSRHEFLHYYRDKRPVILGDPSKMHRLDVGDLSQLLNDWGGAPVMCHQPYRRGSVSNHAVALQDFMTSLRSMNDRQAWLARLEAGDVTIPDPGVHRMVWDDGSVSLGSTLTDNDVVGNIPELHSWLLERLFTHGRNVSNPTAVDAVKINVAGGRHNARRKGRGGGMGGGGAMGGGGGMGGGGMGGAKNGGPPLPREPRQVDTWMPASLCRIHGAWDRLPANATERPCPCRIDLLISSESGRGLAFHYHASVPGNLQVYGRKRWWFSRDPLPGGQNHRRFTAEWLATVYPRLPEALFQPGPPDGEPRIYECTLEPGEMVYVPNGYYHGTMAVGHEINVAFGCDGDVDAEFNAADVELRSAREEGKAPRPWRPWPTVYPPWRPEYKPDPYGAVAAAAADWAAFHSNGSAALAVTGSALTASAGLPWTEATVAALNAEVKATGASFAVAPAAFPEPLPSWRAAAAAGGSSAGALPAPVGASASSVVPLGPLLASTPRPTPTPQRRNDTTGTEQPAEAPVSSGLVPLTPQAAVPVFTANGSLAELRRLDAASADGASSEASASAARATRPLLALRYTPAPVLKRASAAAPLPTWVPDMLEYRAAASAAPRALQPLIRDPAAQRNALRKGQCRSLTGRERNMWSMRIIDLLENNIRTEDIVRLQHALNMFGDDPEVLYSGGATLLRYATRAAENDGGGSSSSGGPPQPGGSTLANPLTSEEEAALSLHHIPTPADKSKTVPKHVKWAWQAVRLLEAGANWNPLLPEMYTLLAHGYDMLSSYYATRLLPKYAAMSADLSDKALAAAMHSLALEPWSNAVCNQVAVLLGKGGMAGAYTVDDAGLFTKAVTEEAHAAYHADASRCTDVDGVCLTRMYTQLQQCMDVGRRLLRSVVSVDSLLAVTAELRVSATLLAEVLKNPALANHLGARNRDKAAGWRAAAGNATEAYLLHSGGSGASGSGVPLALPAAPGTAITAVGSHSAVAIQARHDALAAAAAPDDAEHRVGGLGLHLPAAAESTNDVYAAALAAHAKAAAASRGSRGRGSSK